MISHPIDNPCSPAKADIRNFLKKSVARRALSELGPNDPKANLRMAESLITISAEDFMKKWNFDPISFRPMSSGRYVWSPVKTRRPENNNDDDAPFDVVSDATAHHALQDRLSGLLTHHSLDICCSNTASTTTTSMPLERTDRHPLTTSGTAQSLALLSPIIHRTPSKKIRSASKSGSSSSSKTKQCKITAYGRQRKRLFSNSKAEEGSETEVLTSTPRKKRVALSPSKL